jgi:hypothetical protein
MHHGSFIRTSDGITAHGMVMHHGSFIKTSDGITAHGMVNRNASQLIQNE